MPIKLFGPKEIKDAAGKGKSIPGSIIVPRIGYDYIFYNLQEEEMFLPEIGAGLIEKHLFFYQGNFTITVKEQVEPFVVPPDHILYIKVPEGLPYSVLAITYTAFEVFSMKEK
jgi:hypothetical protein